jgi:hypothetical protein
MRVLFKSITGLTISLAASLLSGCASNDVVNANSDRAPRIISDQPQTAIAGEGSLMPGAFGSRSLQTGQFTGRERTNDQVGQRPTLPTEADPRALARSGETLADGAGTLGQSFIRPEDPVSPDTLMEENVPPAVPAHAAVTPPTSSIAGVNVDSVGAPFPSETGKASSTNSNPSVHQPE